MPPRAFKQVDVFTRTPLLGNPLAVVLDAEGLTTEVMRDFTHWTNLSEATFLLPPTDAGRAAGAHYRVRIFCPGRELPFAGHPTLGSAHAWLEAHPECDDRVLVQECGAGLIRVRRDGDRLAFAAPPRRRSGPLDDAELDRITRGLGLGRADIQSHSWCDNGPGWRGVLLRSAEQVLALKPDPALLGEMDLGVVGPWRGAPPGEPAFEVRAFFPGNSGLTEDPVTGSLNAALGQWLIALGDAPPSYVAAQGTAMGRAGRVYVELVGDDVWIGGQSVTCIDGHVRLP
jgi:PhzF family phenazine biosynthesis protein